MEVCAEAKRVMVQALSKLYSSRTQRGGIPLHRSLLLSLVMRAARDAYHSARDTDTDTGAQTDTSAQEQSPAPAAPHTHTHTQEPMDTAEAPELPELPGGDRTLERDGTADKENCKGSARRAQSRKRRGRSAVEPDFLPCKKARLDPAELRRVLQDSTALRNTGGCGRDTDNLSNNLSNNLSTAHIPRTIVTY
ncbi:immediate early response gene 2 protein [Clarias gariepinus]|uniref:immediate early response gene 2 protein n=1 Tax=Clarias gariepinus TaxID=13013 RepID=UPI00234D2F81|nr:immediate early response gene 2 protein [Clarias gariepinus]